MLLTLEGMTFYELILLHFYLLVRFIHKYYFLSRFLYHVLRMTDNGKDGFQECQRMQNIVDGLGSDTRILVASLRDAETIADLACEGLDTYTFSPAVARQFFDEPLTDIAAAEFEEAVGARDLVGSDSASSQMPFL